MPSVGLSLEKAGTKSFLQVAAKVQPIDAVEIKRRLIIGGLVALLGLIWGLQISLSKLSGEEQGATTGGLLFIHLVLLGIYAAIQLSERWFFVPAPREIVFYFICALLVNIAPLTLELTIAPNMSAGLLTLISCMSPVVTVVFVLLLRCEQVNMKRVLGVGIGVAAASAVIIPQAITGQVTLFWIGLACTLPVIAAIYCIYIKHFWPEGRTALQITGGIIFTGTLFLLPFHFLGSSTPIESLSAANSSLPLWALATSIAVEFYLFSLIIRLGGAVLASCADFIAVLAGFGWGFAIFGEPLAPSIWLAMALGLLALWLACHQSHGEASREHTPSQKKPSRLSQALKAASEVRP